MPLSDLLRFAQAAGYLTGNVHKDVKGSCCSPERFVEGPKRASGEQRGSQETYVHAAQTAPVEPPRLHKTKHLFRFGNASLRQRLQGAENFLAVAERPTGQLSHNQGVAKDLLAVEQGPQALAPHPKMLNPHGGVHQNHAGLVERRLRTRRSRFSVPPSSAKRRALSLDIKASSPRRTNDVFCLTPVSLAA